MEKILADISKCIEFGKINRTSPYPPDMKDQDGADELTKKALDEGIPASVILEQGMIRGMEIVGKKFSENKIFVPQMLMSAKAMSTALEHIKPLFTSGEVKRKGTIIIGTVAGDLHDIGKNLVAMMIEGNGWEVIDIGTDCSAEKFIAKAKENPNSYIGLSALLTTTMMNMESIVKELKEFNSNIKVLIGGAPVTKDFCNKIGADFYSPDPQGAVEYLNQIAS